MRTINTAEILFLTGAAALGASSETHVIQSARAEEIETQFTELLAAQAARSFVLAHVDLAGGGDGHTFVLVTEWAVDVAQQVSVNGIPNDVGQGIQAFGVFYLASEPSALSVEREQAQLRLAPLFGVQGVQQVIASQTLLAGAGQGTRIMGALTGVAAGGIA